MRRHNILLIASLALIATGCNSGAPATDPAAVNDDNVVAAQAGDADRLSKLALSEVRSDDPGVITGNVGGCTFRDKDEITLLFVGVPEDRSAHPTGVARAGEEAITLTGKGSGLGYVDDGPVMASDSLTISIERDPGEGRSTGIETRTWDADLVATDSDGAKRTYAGGTWSCGV